MPISRRHFLQTVIAAASATALPALTGCKLTDDDNDNKSSALPNYFPQSVMSGDPRTNSVILWTRVEDAAVSGDIELTLQVSTDATFATGIVNQTISAQASHDGAVKVRVANLEAYTTYYYRFIYTKNGADQLTNTGRTKTAPASDADTEVKFAYASCQDYIGRYYNTYLRLLEDDMLESIDFVVHLGDYIYETVGDKSFQAASSSRNIEFTDKEGALKIGKEGEEFYAAQSLSNYRQLYKTYRTDPVLQKMQESYPFIVTWDDHEFSDDSWQDNATYLDEAASEKNPSRKKNSERAYLEFMPIDHENVGAESGNVDTEGAIAIRDDQLGDNIKIYRDFNFGANVHLVMSDYRSYRPDHLIPEDAFPGSVVMDSDAINATTAAMKAQALMDDENEAALKAAMSPYMTGEQLKTALGSSYDLFKFGLTQQLQKDAVARGVDLNYFDAKARVEVILQGNIDVYFLNEYIIGPGFGDDKKIPNETLAVLPKGLSYFLMGKTSVLGDLGSRYFVVKDTFDVYSFYKAAVAETKVSGNAYGDDQTAWLTGAMATNTAKWQVLGSSVSLSPLVLDLRSVDMNADGVADTLLAPTNIEALDAGLLKVPSPFNQRFYLNVDHWDGAVIGKKTLIGTLAGTMQATGRSVVSIGGDIHSHYVSELAPSVFDMTSSSVSSGTFGSYLDGGMDSLVSVAPLSNDQKGLIEGLKPYYDILMATASEELKVARTREHGVAVATANADSMSVTFYNLPTKNAAGVEFVESNLYDDKATVLSNITERTYTVDSQTKALDLSKAKLDQ